MNFRIGNLFRELSYSLRRSFQPLSSARCSPSLISMTVLGAGLVLSAAVETATDRWKDGVEFIVFLNPDASEAETSSVTNKLNSSPEIDRFTFVDKEAAFVEFQSMFRDSDQIRESVAVADMPPSFRIVPESPESDVVETLADGFRDDPGVFEVVAAVDTIKDIENGSARINRIFLIVGLALACVGVAACLQHNSHHHFCAPSRSRGHAISRCLELVYPSAVHDRRYFARFAWRSDNAADLALVEQRAFRYRLRRRSCVACRFAGSRSNRVADLAVDDSIGRNHRHGCVGRGVVALP